MLLANLTGVCTVCSWLMTRISRCPGGVEVENALGGEINNIFGTVPRGALASNVMILPIAGKRFRGATGSTPKRCNGQSRG